MKGGFLCAALLAGALAVAFPERAEACTRVVYMGPDGTVLTARSMDWKEDSRSNLWIFPRGMERSGEVGGNPLTWTSRYGSVVTSAYDICSTDGMNEAGLVANLLWLAESAYPEWDGSTPGLSIAAWVQYILDTCATVDEAVAEMESGRFENGYPAPLRIGCRGRQCHIRICGRGSVRSSQSGIQGDD